MAKSEADQIMEYSMGTTMTQVALCRFLIREKVIQKDRLLAYLDERAAAWSQTASTESLLALSTLIEGLDSEGEPPFLSMAVH